MLRAKTDVGSVLSVSMFDAMADWLTVPLIQHEGGMSTRRMGLVRLSVAPYGVLPAVSR